jgi:alpha-L-fucosidase
MTDIISKNGNLLLNVELLPDGTIPPAHKTILDDIGAWVHLNAEAIYASKPWKTYGDNLDSALKRLEQDSVGEADIEALKKQAKSEHFNERTVNSLPYGPEEVRFTTNGDQLYIFVLNPAVGVIELPVLGLSSEYSPKKISGVRLLGGEQKIDFKQESDRLLLYVPENRPNSYTAVFEISGAL